MIPFHKLLLLLRLGQARLSVAYHLQDIERSKLGLAKAFAAYDEAQTALGLLDCDDAQRLEPPTFLLKVRK